MAEKGEAQALSTVNSKQGDKPPPSEGAIDGSENGVCGGKTPQESDESVPADSEWNADVQSLYKQIGSRSDLDNAVSTKRPKKFTPHGFWALASEMRRDLVKATGRTFSDEKMQSLGNQIWQTFRRICPEDVPIAEYLRYDATYAQIKRHEMSLPADPNSPAPMNRFQRRQLRRESRKNKVDDTTWFSDDDDYYEDHDAFVIIKEEKDEGNTVGGPAPTINTIPLQPSALSNQPVEVEVNMAGNNMAGNQSGFVVNETSSEPPALVLGPDTLYTYWAIPPAPISSTYAQAANQRPPSKDLPWPWNVTVEASGNLTAGSAGQLAPTSHISIANWVRAISDRAPAVLVNALAADAESDLSGNESPTDIEQDGVPPIPTDGNILSDLAGAVGRVSRTGGNVQAEPSASLIRERGVENENVQTEIEGQQPEPAVRLAAGNRMSLLDVQQETAGVYASGVPIVPRRVVSFYDEFPFSHATTEPPVPSPWQPVEAPRPITHQPPQQQYVPQPVPIASSSATGGLPMFLVVPIYPNTTGGAQFAGVDQSMVYAVSSLMQGMNMNQGQQSVPSGFGNQSFAGFGGNANQPMPSAVSNQQNSQRSLYQTQTSDASKQRLGGIGRGAVVPHSSANTFAPPQLGFDLPAPAPPGHGQISSVHAFSSARLPGNETTMGQALNTTQ